MASLVADISRDVNNLEITVRNLKGTIVLEGLAGDESYRSYVRSIAEAHVRDYWPLLPRKVTVLDLLQVRVPQVGVRPPRLLEYRLYWVRFVEDGKTHASLPAYSVQEEIAERLGRPARVQVLGSIGQLVNDREDSRIDLGEALGKVPSDWPWSRGIMSVNLQIPFTGSNMVVARLGMERASGRQASGLSMRDGDVDVVFKTMNRPDGSGSSVGFALLLRAASHPEGHPGMEFGLND